jgi:hypothetical protein
MAIAYKYASADSTARVQFAGSGPAAGQSQLAAGQGGHHNRNRHNKRKDEHHDNKYGSKKVAIVQGSSGATGGSQRRKSDKFNKDKYTIKVMLNHPCKFHSAQARWRDTPRASVVSPETWSEETTAAGAAARPAA